MRLEIGCPYVSVDIIGLQLPEGNLVLIDRLGVIASCGSTLKF